MSGPSNYKTAAYKTNNITRMVFLESAGQYPVDPDAEMNGSSWNAYARPSDCGCSSGDEKFSQPDQVGCGCIGMIASSEAEVTIYQIAHAVLKQHLRNFESKHRKLQKTKPRQYDAMRREIIKMAHIAMCTYLVMAGYSDNGYLASNDIGQADSFGFRDAIGAGLASLFGITAAHVPPAAPVAPVVPEISPATQAALAQTQAAPAATAFANRFYSQPPSSASGFGNPPSLPMGNYPTVQPYQSYSGRGAGESFLTTFASAESFLGSTGLSIIDAIALSAKSPQAQNAQPAPGGMTMAHNNAITLFQEIQGRQMKGAISHSAYNSIFAILSAVFGKGPGYACLRPMLPVEQHYLSTILLDQIPPSLGGTYPVSVDQQYVAAIKRLLPQLAIAPSKRPASGAKSFDADKAAALTAAATAKNIDSVKSYVLYMLRDVSVKQALTAAEIAYIQGVLLGKSSFAMPDAGPSSGLQAADIANVNACLAIAAMTTLDEYAVMWLNAATNRAPIHANDQANILKMWQSALKRPLVPAEISYIRALLCGSGFTSSPAASDMPDPTTNPFLAGQLAELSDAQMKSVQADLALKNATTMKNAVQATYDDTYDALQNASASLIALQQTDTSMQLQVMDMASTVSADRTSELMARSAASAAQATANQSASAYVSARNSVNNSPVLKDANLLVAQNQHLDQLSAQSKADSEAAAGAQAVYNAAYYKHMTDVQAQHAQRAAANVYQDVRKKFDGVIADISDQLSSLQQQVAVYTARVASCQSAATAAAAATKTAQANVTSILAANAKK